MYYHTNYVSNMTQCWILMADNKMYYHMNEIKSTLWYIKNLFIIQKELRFDNSCELSDIYIYPV